MPKLTHPDVQGEHPRGSVDLVIIKILICSISDYVGTTIDVILYLSAFDLFLHPLKKMVAVVKHLFSLFHSSLQFLKLGPLLLDLGCVG